MVWEDIDPSILRIKDDIFRMLKVGNDRSTDKISVSGNETGINMDFHCFCPKVFSSIHPLHLMDDFIELKRRLIVVPTTKIEHLPEKRCQQLGIDRDTGVQDLIDIDAYDWKDFHTEFSSFWSYRQAEEFLKARRSLAHSKLGLSSERHRICLDLGATLVSCELVDGSPGLKKILGEYWNWFDTHTKAKESGLTQFIDNQIAQAEKNAASIGITPNINNRQLWAQLENWFEQGWLEWKPTKKELADILISRGYALREGLWRK